MTTSIIPKPRILFICKKRMKQYGDTRYALSSGLLNSATFVSNMLNSNRVESKVVDVIDNNSIDREVRAYNPTHVVIEALWVVPEKFITLNRLYPHIKWNIRLHSETPFLANEGIAVEWIKRYDSLKRYNVSISCNSVKMLADLEIVLGKDVVVYTPNYYPVTTDFTSPNERDTSRIKIGCFGAIRPLKNQLIQAMAAIEFAKSINKPLEYHINADRTESKGESILKNIRALFAEYPRTTLVQHSWMEHPDFIKVVQTMDIGLQVSFSETYNIVSADFVNNNIPIVTSPEVEWMSRLYYANPTSSSDIVSKLKFAYKMKSVGLHRLNKMLLANDSRASENQWINIISRRIL